MIFPPMLGLGPEPRHPSALYEFALEGVVLFVVLWWVSRKPQTQGLISGLFLLLYGTFRFIVEFVRLPDPQLGFIAFDWLTMGQLLTVPMLAAGAFLVTTACRSQRTMVATSGRSARQVI
jgi:phosphatidylglycerol:prolipoprotein diacylglycerol transferase